jgi:hypothetical protein
MLAEIAAELTGMLEQLQVFGSVQGPDGEGALPSAHLWLANDTWLFDSPAVSRMLLWNVQITNYEEPQSADTLSILDAVRDCFSGYMLPGHGHLKIEVPKIELVEYKHPGPMVYVAQLRLTVYPETFFLK